MVMTQNLEKAQDIKGKKAHRSFLLEADSNNIWKYSL